MGAVFDKQAFSGKVPVFPLPNVVLFPGTLLPLHIFEPRYREMMRVALEGERMIAMALLQPGWEPEYYGNPPIHPVMGLGRILDETRLSDGRYTLALQGLARVRVQEIVTSDPFRTAEVEVLEDTPCMAEDRHQELTTLYRQILAQINPAALLPAPEDLELGTLCDVLTSLMPFEPPVKQAFLEELDVAARCERFIARLKELGARSGGAWPPTASLN